MRFLPVAFLAAASALLWGGAIAGVSVHVETGVVCIVLAAATTVSVWALVWWVGLWLRDEDRRMLLLAIADLTRPSAARATGPLMRLVP